MAYRSDVVLLDMVAVVGLVELELPPADDRMRRAPSGLSGVFTRSFVAPASKELNLMSLVWNHQILFKNLIICE